MEKNKISVIVPMYNTEDYIERCIRSIMKQAYKNIEILIVDDGSTDRSLEICQELQREDSRIRIIQQENSGVSKARNVGIENSEGEYIGFVDRDDYLANDMYEKLLDCMNKSNSDLASAGAFNVGRNGVPEDSQYINMVEEYVDDKSILKAYVDGFLTIAVWDKLFTRKVIGDVRFDSTVFCEDAKFVLDVCSNSKKVICTSERLYYHLRRCGNSLTNTSFNEFYMTLYEYAQNKKDEIIKNDSSCEPEAQKLYFNTIYHLIKIYKRDWDRDKLHDYQKDRISFLMDNMTDFLNDNSQYIDTISAIQAKDIIEILNYRLANV